MLPPHIIYNPFFYENFYQISFNFFYDGESD